MQICYNNKLYNMYTSNKEVDIPEIEEDNIEDIAKANGIEFDTLSNHKENGDD